VIVLDSKLIKTTNVTEGLLKNGILVLNSKEKPPEAFTSNKQFKIAMVDATGVSLEVLGVPITNTAMLGAFSASSNWVKIGSICEAIMNRFDKDEAEKNVKAAMSAYERTVVL
jgi:2-oxoacid:acceptor oxidoreductase gamma subunit (pyruvate/2-ketoisovalerate family)